MKQLVASATLMMAVSSLQAGAIRPVVTATPALAPTSAYIPKTHSAFTAGDNLHNPFWPIGWVKTDTEITVDTTAAVPHTEDFLVTTISLNEPPMAVINGKQMAEGEVSGLPVQGRNVPVQLMAVQDGRVILRWQNQNFIVPIHRNEEIHGSITALR